jgi:hypothetical protein
MRYEKKSHDYNNIQLTSSYPECDLKVEKINNVTLLILNVPQCAKGVIPSCGPIGR